MPPIESNSKARFVSICAVLALGTLLLYWPATHHGFLTLDDNQYVTANPHVQAGLTWAGVKWAFQNTEASNWHPLTWLSHMLDCQLFGLNAGRQHLVNILFHAANVLLLFVWLRGATGALWRSALVAALFAWHPLRVESVAWIAERKDVLSAFFWLLALLAYSRYVWSIRTRNYLLVLFLFACGLMSKPMVVTFPFVLLLLDFWPLQRIQIAGFQWSVLKRLLVEKIPFFVLTIAACAINVLAQSAGGATWSSGSLPLAIRLANALVSCLRYVSKTFWPTDLAIVYPYQTNWPLPLVLAGALFLLIWSVLVSLRIRKNPFLFFGWFYFLGTLVPVIGLVQAGPQAMADRYTYLPSIGLLVLIVWGAGELFSQRQQGPKMAVLAGVLTVGGCAVATAKQLRYWDSSVKLFAHTIAVTPDNYAANDYLAGALEAEGRFAEALPFYAESVRITPKFPQAQWGYGLALLKQGHAAEAVAHLAVAAKYVPEDPVIQCYWGRALLDAGDVSAAEFRLARALELKSDYTEAHVFLAVALASQKKFAEAIPHFAAAVKQQPDNAEFHFNLGQALADNRQFSAAADQFSQTLRFTPDHASAHYRLGLALEQQGDFIGAISHYRQALQLAPDLAGVRTALDAVLAAHPKLK